MFINKYTQNYYHIIHWPPPLVFVPHTGNTSLPRGSPLSPLMVQIVSMLLNLVSTQALLNSRSTCSSKLPFFQKATPAITIVDLTCLLLQRMEGVVREHMHETNRIFKQTPPPHFCPKVTCKKGGAYFRELMVYKWPSVGQLFYILCNPA